MVQVIDPQEYHHGHTLPGHTQGHQPHGLTQGHQSHDLPQGHQPRGHTQGHQPHGLTQAHQRVHPLGHPGQAQAEKSEKNSPKNHARKK